MEGSIDMGRSLIVGISAAAMAAGVGLGATQLANAETTAPTPTQSASPSPGETASGDDTGHAGRGEHRGAGLRVDLSELATRLGVDEAKLEEAVKVVSADTGRPTTPPTEEDRTARRAAFAKALASELGLDESKVAAAIEELRAEAEAERAADQSERLASAVTDGTLTQAEADAVKKALDEGIVTMRGGRNR